MGVDSDRTVIIRWAALHVSILIDTPARAVATTQSKMV